MKVKLFVISLIFFVCAKTSLAQTAFAVSFTQTTDTVSGQGQWAYFNATLTNVSAVDTVNIKATFFDENLFFGWTIYLCPSSGCLTSMDTTATVTLETLQTDTFQVKLFTGAMDIGNGNFTMRFENMADSTDLIDTTLYIKYVLGGVGIEESKSSHNYLSQNYPNPFSQSTTIYYKLQTAGGKLHISDIFGKKINQYNLQGRKGQITVDDHFLPGVYYYSLVQQEKIIVTRKFIIMSSVK